MVFVYNLLWSQAPFLVLGICIAALIGYLYFSPLCYFSLFFFLFCLYFFRNPERVCSARDSFSIVCPADGKIIAIEEGDECRKVAIYLSLWDVHVQWAPISGLLTDISYHPGKFFRSFTPKCSLENEYNLIRIEHESGQTITVRQIAGFVARRIVCWVKAGQEIKVCKKFGMIRFGSQVEITIPKSAELFVSLDERVFGGKTLLGRLEQL